MAKPAVLTHPESLKRPAGPSEYAKDPVNASMSKAEKIALYTKMARIRHFEQRCIRIYQQGKIGGFLHLYVGQEAVAAGTMMAVELSRRLGWLSGAEVDRVRKLMQRAGLPVRGPDLGVARYLELMSRDKKVIAGTLRLVLLKAIGEAVVTADFPASALQATLDACCGPVRA